MTKPILVRHEEPLAGGIHRIVLDRPEARNAISREVLAQLDDRLDEILALASVMPSGWATPPRRASLTPSEAHQDANGSSKVSPPTSSSASRSTSPSSHHTSTGSSKDPASTIRSSQAKEPLRCVIIESSSTNAFCAGADLIERKSMSEQEVVSFLSDLRRIFDKIFDKLAAFPVPTIAAIDGPALGGGLELSLACDFRIASPSVDKLGFPEVQLGIIPGAGGTQRAPRLIGLARAKELIYTGRLIDAETAKSWGLIDYLADEGQTAAQRALALAQRMAKSGPVQPKTARIPTAPLALASAKMAISHGLDFELEDALQWERMCYEKLLPTQDRREALLAFAAKRKPNFVGK
ncbi:Enoyl-CoA hydratase [Ceraceosorus bombacis]|uniref:Enoyl-CoA hydratase n=1 Tax=Ceraceosorus bombacis TaxID=401625 RepID=A0A0P1BEX9_9BASI|nr:Enoyl-CoA hydratase [Ceraceosorus bombacis]